MAPDSSHDITTIPPASAEPAAPTGPRLSLDPALPQGGGINGGWWPRSRDAGAELPGMLTELTARAGRVSGHAPEGGAAGGPAEASVYLAEDHERIALGLNDVVVRRVFAAGLDLHAALALMGDHHATDKIGHAIDELDQAPT